MKKMFYLLYAAAGILCSSLVSGQTDVLHTAQGFRHPESICAGKAFLYVSNLGAALLPNTKDGDGFISRLSNDGKVLDTFFISHLDAPKGMAIVDEVLYVTDIDAIKGFRLSDGKEVYHLGFEKENTRFLNDLAVKDRHTLFVSATDIGKVFEVQLGSRPACKAIALQEKIKGANGLEYDTAHNILYVVELGENGAPGMAGKITWEKGTPVLTYLSKDTGYYDGVALAGKQLLVSDWVSMDRPDAGMIKTIDLQTGQAVPLMQHLQGGADFLYLPATKTIWVPEMLANKVTAYQLR